MDLTRIDLSDNLIHFVSEANKGSVDYNQSEMHPKEFIMNGDWVEEEDLSPFFILRRILRNLQLLSTWSYRKGQRIIYGDYPVVCFTEMPLSEFVRTSIDRQEKGQKISNYGLIFNKKQMFSLGARPVIYGCSQNVRIREEKGAKILEPAIFDAKELYRFVSFKLDRLPYPIDWTHEREWRWANFAYKYYPIDLALWGDEECDNELEELFRKREEERLDFHGLNLDKEQLSNIGIIIKTERQANLIVKDILWLIDSRRIPLYLFGYILFFNQLEENIDKLIDKEYVNETIEKGVINIEKYYEINDSLKKNVKGVIDEICALYENYNKFPLAHQGGQSGIAFPCLIDNREPVARALVALGLVKCTRWGSYLIDLPILHPTNCLENNEDFVRNVLNPMLERELGIKMNYYSIGDLNKFRTKQNLDIRQELDINDVPFYTSPNDDDVNYAHNEEDY